MDYKMPMPSAMASASIIIIIIYFAIKKNTRPFGTEILTHIWLDAMSKMAW
jgi:hypothetical protein